MHILPIVGLMAASLAVVIYKVQFMLIYPSSFPEGSRTEVDTPDTYGMSYTEDKLLTPDGEYIRIYTIPSKARSNTTVVFLGPNAGNMGYYLPMAAKVHEMGYNVVTLSYRGYGKSTGSPSEKGLKIDVSTCLRHITDNQPDQNIVLYGRSLGGAVAIYAATSLPFVNVHAVILENTFTSVPDVVPSVIPFVSAKVAYYAVTQKWESYKLIPKVKCPILFQAGGSDELIPPKMFRSLYDLCESPHKEYNLYPKGYHNDTVIQRGYWADFEAFLKKFA